MVRIIALQATRRRHYDQEFRAEEVQMLLDRHSVQSIGEEVSFGGWTDLRAFPNTMALPGKQPNIRPFLERHYWPGPSAAQQKELVRERERLSSNREHGKSQDYSVHFTPDPSDGGGRYELHEQDHRYRSTNVGHSIITGGGELVFRRSPDLSENGPGPYLFETEGAITLLTTAKGDAVASDSDGRALLREFSVSDYLPGSTTGYLATVGFGANNEPNPTPGGVAPLNEKLHAATYVHNTNDHFDGTLLQTFWFETEPDPDDAGNVRLVPGQSEAISNKIWGEKNSTARRWGHDFSVTGSGGSNPPPWDVTNPDIGQYGSSEIAQSEIWGYNPIDYRSHLYRGFEIDPTPDPFNVNSGGFAVGDRGSSPSSAARLFRDEKGVPSNAGPNNPQVILDEGDFLGTIELPPELQRPPGAVKDAFVEIGGEFYPSAFFGIYEDAPAVRSPSDIRPFLNDTGWAAAGMDGIERISRIDDPWEQLQSLPQVGIHAIQIVIGSGELIGVAFSLGRAKCDAIANDPSQSQLTQTAAVILRNTLASSFTETWVQGANRVGQAGPLFIVGAQSPPIMAIIANPWVIRAAQVGVIIQLASDIYEGEYHSEHAADFFLVWISPQLFKATTAPKSGLLNRIGSADLPYWTKVTTEVKVSRFFATRTGYQQVIKHSPIIKWLQTKGWQVHHWFIARSKGLAGSEGLRRVTEAGWNLIPLPARWNRVISNGGIGFLATRLLVGASPGIALYAGYKFGSFVIDVGWWITGGETDNE